MATTLQFRRGNSAAAAAVTGANGEIYINTQTKTVHVHDGSTAGGIPQANASSVTAAISTASSDASTKAATAYTNATAFAANATNIASGTVAPARLGSGTANSTTVLHGNGTWAEVAGGTDLTAISTDVKPITTELYDIGSSANRWYDAYLSNSLDINGSKLSGTSTILSTTSDMVVGSLLADDILISNNLITPADTTVRQYQGDKGVVVINGNLDVQGDWLKVPVVATVGDVVPLTTGDAGIVRYNEDTSTLQLYDTTWKSLAIAGIQSYAVLSGASANNAMLQKGHKYFIDTYQITRVNLPWPADDSTLVPGDVIEIMPVDVDNTGSNYLYFDAMASVIIGSPDGMSGRKLECVYIGDTGVGYLRWRIIQAGVHTTDIIRFV